MCSHLCFTSKGPHVNKFAAKNVAPFYDDQNFRLNRLNAVKKASFYPFILSGSMEVDPNSGLVDTKKLRDKIKDF